MNTSRSARRSSARVVGAGLLALLIAGMGAVGASAQDEVAPRQVRQVKKVRVAAAAPPLTVHRRAARLASADPIVAGDGFYDGVGVFRRWDDPRLYSFYGWRLGGDNFYGDQAGETITRGNAGLGMIAGYGGARGGYGGPHFDSVGGFHNGPGPGAQEAEDYASGDIWTPRYDRPLPTYPTVKQQVAQLNTGLSGTGQVSRVKSTRERWAEAYRAGDLPRPGEAGAFPVSNGMSGYGGVAFGAF